MTVPMNFCSHCGSPQLEWIIPPGDQIARQVCSQCHTVHYKNPDMIVGCLLVKDDRILLAKRAIEPRLNFWNLPAGFLENDETVESGAVREVLEETAIVAKPISLLCVYNLLKSNQVYLIFLAEQIAGEASVTSESAAVEYFKPEDIPWDAIAFSSSDFALKYYLENKHLPFIPTAISGDI